MTKRTSHELKMKIGERIYNKELTLHQAQQEYQLTDFVVTDALRRYQKAHTANKKPVDTPSPISATPIAQIPEDRLARLESTVQHLLQKGEALEDDARAMQKIIMVLGKALPD